MHNPKYPKLRKFHEDALRCHKDELFNSGTIKEVDNHMSINLNTTFDVVFQSLLETKDNHFTEITVHFYRYKHELNKGIRAGILHSIKYGNDL